MLFLGITIVLLVFHDVIQTALRIGQRGGPLTLHFASSVWKMALRFPRLVEKAGVLIVLGIVVVWVVFSWAGWSLVFAAWEGSVVTSDTKVPADLVGKVYFAGYTIFTLGNGDYQPLAGWRVVTVIANATTLIIVTLAITYLIPLLSAVVEKRALAGRISLLGGTPKEIVQKLGSPGGSEVQSELSSFPQELLLLKERHLAYPVLHYFQGRDPNAAIGLNLAVLTDALAIACDAARDPDPSLVAVGDKLATAIARLVAALEPWFVTDPPDPPPAPDLAFLSETSFQPRSPEEFAARLDDNAELRRQVRWMVEDTGWSWSDATGERNG